MLGIDHHHIFSNLIHRCMQYVEFVVLNLAVIVNTVIVYGKYIIIIIKLSNLSIYFFNLPTVIAKFGIA